MRKDGDEEISVQRPWTEDGRAAAVTQFNRHLSKCIRPIACYENNMRELSCSWALLSEIGSINVVRAIVFGVSTPPGQERDLLNMESWKTRARRARPREGNHD